MDLRSTDNPSAMLGLHKNITTIEVMSALGQPSRLAHLSGVEEQFPMEKRFLLGGSALANHLLSIQPFGSFSLQANKR